MASQDNPPFKMMLEITPTAAINTAMNFTVEIRLFKNDPPRQPPSQLVIINSQKKHLRSYHYRCPQRATFDNPINAPQII